ncbi:hypothetical protein ACWCRD_06220 [Streptomyces sp. NPDC002092]
MNRGSELGRVQLDHVTAPAVVHICGKRWALPRMNRLLIALGKYVPEKG